jgi:hypothetical protein
VAAIRGAYPKASRRYCPYAVTTHEALDAATACRVPQVMQSHVDSRCAISDTMGHMEPADLAKQGAIGCLARTFRPATPGIIPRRRDAHNVAQDANRECLKETIAEEPAEQTVDLAPSSNSVMTLRGESANSNTIRTTVPIVNSIPPGVKPLSGLITYETVVGRLGREFEDTLPEFFHQGRRAVYDG